jgi:hypothetical protein
MIQEPYEFFYRGKLPDFRKKPWKFRGLGHPSPPSRPEAFFSGPPPPLGGRRP